MQTITISGNIGNDAELRSVGDTQVCSFNVAVKNGFGNDAETVWYRCSLWGKAGKAFNDSLKKGTKVFINGELTHDEYQGKPQFNIRVSGIDTAPRNSGNQSSGQSNQSGDWGSSDNASSQFGDDDLDDSVPF